MSEFTNITTVQFSDPNASSYNPPPAIQANIGGYQSYSVPVESAPIAPHQQMGMRIESNMGGVLQWDAASGGVQRSTSVSTVEASELSNRGNFLDTGRNGFFPAQGNLTPDTIVQFQGMEVSLGSLESLGIVQRTANGGYAVAGGGQQGTAPFPGEQQQAEVTQQPPQSQQAELPAGVELFSEAVEASVAMAIDPVPQGIYDHAIATAVAQGVDGINWNELAYQSGMMPEDARSRGEVVAKAFTDQANGIAQQAGVQANELADVWQWAMAERSEQLMDARRHLVTNRNTDALKALVADYFTSVPPTHEALVKAGIPHRHTASGEDIYFINGAWLTADVAAKSKLI